MESNPDAIRIFVNLLRMSPMDMSFDELKTLFETNPQAAEQKCNEIIENYILSLPEDRQQRARSFQWQLEQKLRHYKDPIARMNKMIELFWSGVNKFHTALTEPETLIRSVDPVVQFPSKK
jgi:hypothetical protein